MNIPNLYKPEGMLIHTAENREFTASRQGLENAMLSGKILEGEVMLCDENMNLHIDLCGIPGIIPKNEIQVQPEGEKLRDIAAISRVGRPACFKVIGMEHSTGGRARAILSRRSAQLECMGKFIGDLIPGDIIDAKITHMEPFGAFSDIGCGVVALLPVDAISVSRISHPRDRFESGDFFKAVIKTKSDEDGGDGRIFITTKELLGTWEENVASYSVGQTVAGTVSSIAPYGVFVELAPNLAGLAEVRADMEIGRVCAVYIKNIIPEKMKIKLVIIDAYKDATPRRRLKYFINDREHIDRWRYSPDGCEKVVESVF